VPAVEEEDRNVIYAFIKGQRQRESIKRFLAEKIDLSVRTIANCE